MTNPALNDLSFLIGKWNMKLSNADFMEDEKSLTGRVSFEWLDEAFIVMRSIMEEGPPKSISVIGRNESKSEYEMIYYDARGVSRIYTVTFKENLLTFYRDDPDFYQRFSGKLAKDKKTLIGKWENSHNKGKTWQHDFDLTYTKTVSDEELSL